MLDADQDLLTQADFILSIVPPADAVRTAKRFTQVAHVRDKDKEPLFYIDLNAISPSRARSLQLLFKDYPIMRFLDGGVSQQSIISMLIFFPFFRSCPEAIERSLEAPHNSIRMVAGPNVSYPSV